MIQNGLLDRWPDMVASCSGKMCSRSAGSRRSLSERATIIFHDGDEMILTDDETLLLSNYELAFKVAKWAEDLHRNRYREQIAAMGGLEWQ